MKILESENLNIVIGLERLMPKATYSVSLRQGLKSEDNQAGSNYMRIHPKAGDIITLVFDRGNIAYWVNMAFQGIAFQIDNFQSSNVFVFATLYDAADSIAILQGSTF